MAGARTGDSLARVGLGGAPVINCRSVVES